MPSEEGIPAPSLPPPPGKPGSHAPAPPEQPPSPKLPDRGAGEPEPQGPPPLPNLPHAPGAEPPHTSSEWPGPPPAPSSGGPRPATGVLAGVIAVSLLANVVLAARVADTNRRVEAAQDRVVRLTDEVTRLRDRLSESQQGGSPIDRVMEAVSRIRGLSFERKVDAEILTDAALRQRILDEIQKADERTQIAATDKVLTAFGLLKPTDDLFDILVDVQTEQIGGFYDSDTHKLVVAGTAASPKPVDRFLLSHELTHAVTDQRFNLSRIDELQQARKDDEATAFLALAEGDATVVMDVYRADYLSDAERKQVEESLRGTSSARFRAAPAIVQQSLLFPYESGVIFVGALIRRGGYALVNKAYEEPPTSTEQIMHPAKYMTNRDDPQTVTLPDVAVAMGPGWKEIDAGGIGELDVRLIVDEFLPRADANTASEGWDGGHYVAVSSGAGTLVVTSTVWDSDSEAREAAEILERWLRDRFGGRGAAYRVDGGRGWDAPTGAGAVVRNGDKVFLIIGPDKTSVEKARSAAGASGTSA